MFQLFPKVDKVGQQRFRLSNEYKIQKGGKRLGIEEKRYSASRHQGVRCGPVLRPSGNCSKLEHFDKVCVIVFISNGEGRQVKIEKRPLRFDRQQASGRLSDHGEIFGLRVKYTLAHYCFK